MTILAQIINNNELHVFATSGHDVQLVNRWLTRLEYIGRRGFIIRYLPSRKKGKKTK